MNSADNSSGPAQGGALGLLMAVDAPAHGDTLTVGTAIEGFGWAMSGNAITQVTVEIGGEVICRAAHGVDRPDLRAAFATYPDAGNAGFRFRTILETSVRGETDLIVRATFVDGRERLQSVRIKLIENPLKRSAIHAIWSHLDEATLRNDGELYVFGWALSESGIERIGILVDGAEVGEAQLQLERLDIGRLFPDIPRARHAGFGVHKRLQGDFTGVHAITAVIREGNGDQRQLSRTVRVVPPPPKTVTEELFKIEIDIPTLPADRSPFPVKGSLTVQGWAVGRGSVERIAVAVDDLDVGNAYYGVRREDVAAAFRDWPDSLLSGFGISIPAKALPPGVHRVKLTAFDRLGRNWQSEFSVSVEKTSALNPCETIHTRMGGAALLVAQQILDALNWHPRFECVLRVSRGEEVLKRAHATLASLAAQEYEHWNVTIAAEAETDSSTLLPSDLAHVASRVRFAAAAVEDSEPPAESLPPDTFFCILDAGDRLGCDAMLEIALSTGLNRELEFIYADDRRYDPALGAVSAWPKPDWSPDLLLSSNYIGRSWFARMDLLPRAGLEIATAQLQRRSDYDLTLRLTGAAKSIGHVPKILLELANHPIDADADRAALIGEQRRRGIKGSVMPGGVPGVYRLRRSVAREAAVSIVIPTRGSRGLIRDCITSIRRTTGTRQVEIVCIENIPPGEAALRQWLAEHADQVITTDDPFNWSRFNNLCAAVAHTDSEFLLFLNDDIEAIDPDWLDALLEHAQREDVGAVGPLLLYPDRRVQHAGMFMAEVGRARHAFRFARCDETGPFGLMQSQRNVLAVTGACLLVRRSVFDAMGGFDEAHQVVNNDLDFCLRCHERGLKVIYTPYARLIHHEMASRSSDSDIYDAKRFKERWTAAYAFGDPFYNHALSRSRDDYSLDQEPTEVVFGGPPLLAKQRIHRILVIKLDHVGDFITALPALRRIKAHFPDANLTLMTSGTNLELARLEPCIDEVMEFNFFHARSSLGLRELSAEDLADLKSRVAQRRFELAIDLRKHLDTRPLLLEVGAKLTAGFDYQGRFPWLDIAIEWDGDPPLVSKRQHVSEDLLRLVDAVGTSCNTASSESGQAVGAEWVGKAGPLPTLGNLFAKPVVCVHPGSGNPLRQWPAEYFAELIRMLLQAFDVNITLIGGPDEEALVRNIWQMNDLHTAIYPLAGTLPLQHLPQLLSQCALFVGNNSGPQHVAASLAVPTIGIHSGVVDAVEWAPVGRAAVAIRRNTICSPCYLALPEQCRRDVTCLKSLRPSDVFEVCRRFLAINAVRPDGAPTPLNERRLR